LGRLKDVSSVGVSPGLYRGAPILLRRNRIESSMPDHRPSHAISFLLAPLLVRNVVCTLLLLPPSPRSHP
jgi:hypothetical protein